MEIIGISGTPGTGKTSICSELSRRGLMVLTIEKLMRKNPDIVTGWDKNRRVREVDTRKAKTLIRLIARQTKTTLVIDSHFSHLIGADRVIVLRCRPSTLQRRLLKRRYSSRKRLENLEAEAMGVITIESTRRLGKDNVYEIDTTRRSIKGAARVAYTIIHGDSTALRSYKAGRIDWEKDILDWY